MGWQGELNMFDLLGRIRDVSKWVDGARTTSPETMNCSSQSLISLRSLVSLQEQQFLTSSKSFTRTFASLALPISLVLFALAVQCELLLSRTDEAEVLTSYFLCLWLLKRATLYFLSVKEK